MALLLDSNDIEPLLTAKLCIDALDDAFRDYGMGKATTAIGREVILTRLPDKEVPAAGARKGHAYHGLEVQSGSVPRYQVACLRVKSDILYWPEVDGDYRRKKYPGAPGGLFCGFVILFDNDTGAPVALMPDGLIQRLRVGATSALGARYMAPEDAEVAAVIGSGNQGESQAIALAEVRPNLKEIRIFSPTKKNREDLAARLDEQLPMKVVPAESAQEAVSGAQIVHAGTNSRAPVVKADWLDQGTHVSVISVQEIGEEILGRSNRVGTSRRYSPKQSHTAIADGFAEDVHEDEFGSGWWHNQAHWDRMVTLGDMMNGNAVGRASKDENTTFITKGAAMQFAAVGAKLAEEARRTGVGKEIPTEWFLQPYQP